MAKPNSEGTWEVTPGWCPMPREESLATKEERTDFFRYQAVSATEEKTLGPETETLIRSGDWTGGGQ